jgi:hypothetical protein
MIFTYDYSTRQLLIVNPVFRDELIRFNISLVTLWMHLHLYYFSCLHEIKECM